MRSKNNINSLKFTHKNKEIKEEKQVSVFKDTNNQQKKHVFTKPRFFKRKKTIFMQ